MTTATETKITFSNYRVEYVAPNYEEGHASEPRCAILADDAEFNGATVRVFNVPDPDESQRAVAQFACDAMNAHARLIEALQRWIAEPKCASPTCCGDRGYHDSLLFNARQAIDSAKPLGTHLQATLTQMETNRHKTLHTALDRLAEIQKLNWKLEQAQQERDAARTENERLNAQLRDWQEEKDTKAGYL